MKEKYYQELLSIFEKRYYSEVDRNEKINASMLVSTSFLFPLIGFAFKKLRDFTDFSLDVNSGLIVLVLLFIVISAILIFKTITGHEFGYLPYLTQALDYIKKLEVYYNDDYFKLTNAPIDKMFQDDFYSFILTAFVKYTDINISSNLRKLKYRRLSFISMFICYLIVTLHLALNGFKF